MKLGSSPLRRQLAHGATPVFLIALIEASRGSGSVEIALCVHGQAKGEGSAFPAGKGIEHGSCSLRGYLEDGATAILAAALVCPQVGAAEKIALRVRDQACFGMAAT